MKARFPLALGLAVVLICSSAALAQTNLNNDGIGFPDGTQQTTAATTATPIEVVPQQCHVDAAPGDHEYALCYGYTPGNHTWSDTNGVPTGHYFVVTNIIITPTTTSETGEWDFYLYHISGCDNGVEGGTGLARYVRVALVPDAQTFVLNSTAPIFVLSPGSCLRVDAFAANTSGVKVHYNGFLTADPDYIFP